MTVAVEGLAAELDGEHGVRGGHQRQIPLGAAELESPERWPLISTAARLSQLDSI